MNSSNEMQSLPAETRAADSHHKRASNDFKTMRPSERSNTDEDSSIVLKAPAVAQPVSRSRRTLVWLFQIAVALGIGYWFATSRATPDTRLDLPAEMKQQVATPLDEAVPVTTSTVVRRNVERAIDAVGNLHGYDELTLKTKVSGRVAKIYHDFADRVKPGELLLEIDPTDAELAVEQARRSLNSELAKWGFEDVPQADADLSQLPTVVSAKLRSDWSKSQLSRLTALQNRGSASAEELEQAKTNAMVAESDFGNQLLLARSGAATAQLKKAELDIAQQQLNETRIYVPRSEAVGELSAPHYTITDRYVTEGAYLASGSELFRLVVDETLKLRLPISEKYAAQVKVGQRVEVSTLTATKPAIGTIVRVGPAVDPQTRTFQIEAEVPNSDAILKTGGFAKGRVIIDDQSVADTVPVSALVTFAGVHKIFVLAGDRVKEVQVVTGEQTPEWIEIVEPRLPSGTVVIVSGQSQLADGSLVRLRQTESTSREADASAPSTGSEIGSSTEPRIESSSTDDGAAK